jgi:hypothetical protein
VHDSFREPAQEFAVTLHDGHEDGVLKVEALSYGRVLGRGRLGLAATGIDGGAEEGYSPVVAHRVVVA